MVFFPGRKSCLLERLFIYCFETPRDVVHVLEFLRRSNEEENPKTGVAKRVLLWPPRFSSKDVTIYTVYLFCDKDYKQKSLQAIKNK